MTTNELARLAPFNDVEQAFVDRHDAGYAAELIRRHRFNNRPTLNPAQFDPDDLYRVERRERIIPDNPFKEPIC